MQKNESFEGFTNKNGVNFFFHALSGNYHPRDSLCACGNSIFLKDIPKDVAIENKLNSYCQCTRWY